MGNYGKNRQQSGSLQGPIPTIRKIQAEGRIAVRKRPGKRGTQL